jgi:hypothetical protein
MCRGSEIPSRTSTLLVSEELLDQAPLIKGQTRESLRIFKVGDFLHNHRNNWTNKGLKIPCTHLDDEDKLKIEALPWFKSWIGGGTLLIKWKVNVIHNMCRGLDAPSRTSTLLVSDELLDQAPLLRGQTRESLRSFKVGEFLHFGRNNWTNKGSKKPHTQLDDGDKLKIEVLPWFKSWIGGGTLLIKWKVNVIHTMCRGSEVPSRTSTLLVSDELLDLAPLIKGKTRESLRIFKVGEFLHFGRNNWTNKGSKKPHTQLDDEDKLKIEALPWFKSWIGGVTSLVKWKVNVIHTMCRGSEVPSQTSTLPVSDELLDQAPLIRGQTRESLRIFKVGYFLHAGRNNWTNKGSKKPYTHLDDEDKLKIEALPWFESWISGKRGKKRSIEEEQTRSVRSCITPSSPEEKSPTIYDDLISAGYDAAKFNEEHHAFKDECNQLFVHFVEANCDNRCNIVYLDAFDGTTSKLRTTTALLDAKIGGSRLFLPNDDQKVIDAFLMTPNCIHGVVARFDEAILKNWSDLKFGAAYIDLCNSSADIIKANFDILIPHLVETQSVLAFTFIARGVEKGDTGTQKQYELDSYLRRHRFERALENGYRGFAHVVTQFYMR